ncbi:MAG: 1-acylglycerol-3-phosphate O-acyltransferase [Firmicutes bacterium]|nr:1-acylglycerol-3-phosphate O-acyltransferase [[Eubacterium] siraeum]MCM1488345.1 1-acylglycerol-3-phosphate O-acyltransferase [Bacillota bacterium]
MIVLYFLLGFLTGFLGIALLFFIVLTVSALLVDPNRFYEDNSKYYRFLLYFSSVFALIGARVKVKVIGKENIPQKGRFLLVCNHLSNFDPIVCWTVLRHRDTVAYISKPENFRIPWYGRIIRRCGFIDIDRQNPRNAAKTIHRAAELIIGDKFSIGVFPEGTRSRSCKLLTFHNMVFRIAQEANVPILVVAVLGTEKVRKNFPLRKNSITVKFVDCISAEEVQALKTNQIGERVRSKLLEALGQTDTEEKDNTAA